MADNVGIYDITGAVQQTVSSSLYSALLPPSGNINIRRWEERHNRDLAEISASNVALGFSTAFVIPTISSSQHERTELNAFFSGSELLETSAVPASSQLFYSKKQTLRKLTYYVTASAYLTDLTGSTYPALDEYDLIRPGYVPGSGSYLNKSMWDPAVIEFDVPEHGKIRDIKVWIEFVHDHRGGPGSGSFLGNPFLVGGAGDLYAYPKQGLQGVQISLRSPNVDFPFAHPLWNDETVRYREKWPASYINYDRERSVPELLKSSYLLWAGHACEEDLGYLLGSQTGSNTTYLSSTLYTQRDITSASMGPGINNAISSDYTSAYSLGNYRPAFRNVSSIPLGGTQVGVLYPTVYGQWEATGRFPFPFDIFNARVVAFFKDDGTTTDPSPQLFFTSSQYSNTIAHSVGFSPNNLRLRAQKNSPYIHAACVGSDYSGATQIIYGMRGVGDDSVNPWTIKFPVQGTGSAISQWYPSFSADCFMDFALDSRGCVHFVTNQWRGDLGIDVLNYSFFSGAINGLGYEPPGTVAMGGDFPNYKFFKTNVMTLIDGTVPVSTASILSVDNTHKLTAGQTIVITSGSTSETTDVLTVLSENRFIAPVSNSYGAGGVAYVYSSNMLWSSGSLNMFGELDNPYLNDPTRDSVPGSLGPYCQIEIDKNDIIHVVYSDTTNMSVKYAKKPVAYSQWTGSWAFELVHTHSSPSTWPTYISLDIDESSNPHVAYSLFDGVVDNIYYAKSGSGGWALERVASTDGLKIGTRLKIDNEGVPTIVSTIANFDGKGNEGVIVFRSSSFSGWNREKVYLDTTDNPRETTLTFDVNNKARVYTVGERLAGLWQRDSAQQAKYSEYDTDIDMRTVFTDSSRNINPRNLTPLYTGRPAGSSSLRGNLIVDGHHYASPFSSSIRLLHTAGVWGTGSSHVFDPTLDHTNHLTGANVPWFFDDRIPPGIFRGLNYQATISSALGLSPPPGWLSGPGGTAAVNEYPTTGSNLGPTSIQPVYPLLDDLFVEKVYDQPSLTANATIIPASHKPIIGFRPGLRGTEINGKWKLMFATAADNDIGGSPDGISVQNPRSGIWFRQARIEFVVDSNEGFGSTDAGKLTRYEKKGLPAREGNRLVAILSGSSAWDVGVNYVYSYVPVSYGRTLGMTDSTGSLRFAVFSQLTGSFVDALSGSGRLEEVRRTFLNNEFGVPYIPVSSGSGENPSFDVYTKEDVQQSRDVFDEIINPKTDIPRDNTLRAHLVRSQVVKTVRDSLSEKLAGIKKL